MNAIDELTTEVPFPLGTGEVGVHTASGEPVRIRHLVRGDAALLVALFGGLSAQTRWLRFFTGAGIPDERLWHEATRMSEVNPLVQAALVATVGAGDGERAIGVAQLIRDAALTDTAEVAIVLADDYQRQGIGQALFDLLVQVALVQGIESLVAITLPENVGMQRLARGVGLPLHVRRADGEMRMTLRLGS